MAVMELKENLTVTECILIAILGISFILSILILIISLMIAITLISPLVIIGWIICKILDTLRNKIIYHD